MMMTPMILQEAAEWEFERSQRLGVLTDFLHNHFLDGRKGNTRMGLDFLRESGSDGLHR